MDHSTEHLACHLSDEIGCEDDMKRRSRPDAKAAERIAIQTVLSLVNQIAEDAFEGVRPARRKSIVAKLIFKAHGWGMTDPHDIAIFCVLSRHPGEWFFQQPAWLEAAERVKNEETTWTQVFQEPQIWK